MWFGSGKQDEAPTSLNARRDAYVRSMRALCRRLVVAMPPDLDGILGRTESLLAGQAASLERLAGLDLEGDDPLPIETAHALLRAQQLPRMILALGEVLAQQEEDERLRPVQQEALDLARELADLTQAWLASRGDVVDWGELEEE
ncbi:MAG: hypothetical protein D6731_09745 [Planctomycetota bacterium]|nr:MAG: hypothetical protein D6731_09745 [Planctomycetota bacterium]